MKPLWTKAAIRDLVHIREYIARDNPDAAREIALKTVDATERIIEFPEVGRSGRVNGTRELVLSGTPYLIVYRLKKKAVHFVRVLHASRKWPNRKP